MTEIDFTMPDVGEGLHEAEIVEWLVAVGDAVREDQPVVVVQTDKAVVDIPSPFTGTILGWGAQVGEIVAVGDVLFRVSTAAISAPAPAPSLVPSRPQSLAVVASPDTRPKASPATRKRALDLGITLSSVAGSGPGGRIESSDVEAAARPSAVRQSAVQPDPSVRPTPLRAVSATVVPMGDDRVEPLRGVRRQIARTMTESWQNIPHVTEFRELDATYLVRAHATLRSKLEPSGVRLTFLPLFVKAVVSALQQHPEFNASLDLANETITYRHRFNIGIATSSDDGLIVPVISDADRKSLRQIAVEIDALAAAVRQRTIRADQLAGGTFTISNYGSFGTWMGTPIIRPPEAAIAGFGRIHDAVVPVNGQPAVRTVLPLAISADHRLLDGHQLGAFVATLAEILGDPVLLLAEGSWS